MISSRQRTIYAALFCWIFFLQGTLSSLIAHTDSFINELSYEGITSKQYGLFFLSLGLGAAISAFLSGRYAQKNGCSGLYKLGIGCHLFAFYLIGMLFLALSSPLLSLSLFIAALFFWGIGFGVLISISSAFTFYYFSKRPESAFIFFYAFFGLGGFIALIPSAYIWIFILFAILSYGALFLLLDYFEMYQTIFVTHSIQRPLKGVWSLLLALFLFGLYISLIFNWPVYQSEESHKISPYLQSGVTVVGRCLTALFLYWISFRTLYWALPLLLFLNTILIPFAEGIWHSILTYSIYLIFSGIWALLLCFGIREFPFQRFDVAGKTVAASAVGYGLAAFVLSDLLHGVKPSSMTLAILTGVLTFSTLVLNVISLREMRHE